MNKLTLTSATGILALASGFAVLPSVAAAEVTANVGVVSNYLFRSVSQTNGASAVQGGVDYANDSGFYAGTWTSSVDFGDATNYELDLYTGFSGNVESLGYDVGYIYYAYPDAPGSIDFGEIYGELSYQYFAAGIAYTTNSQVSGNGVFNTGDIYYHVSATVPLSEQFSASLLVGRYNFADNNKPGVGEANYNNVTATLTRNAADFGEFSLNVDYADIQASDALGSVNSNDPKVWVGWSKAF